MFLKKEIHEIVIVMEDLEFGVLVSQEWEMDLLVNCLKVNRKPC